MEKNFHRTFTKCPCCGSEDRFLEQLGNEMKERGLAREEWSFHMDVREGIVVDKTKEASILVGAEVPVFSFMTDICMECGCVYAIIIERKDIKKPEPPPSMLMPNRAERRRDNRDDGIITSRN